MIHCMGADYMTMIPMYLSYADANLLTDIKIYPQFINNTLYDNQNRDIITINRIIAGFHRVKTGFRIGNQKIGRKTEMRNAYGKKIFGGNAV